MVIYGNMGYGYGNMVNRLTQIPKSTEDIVSLLLKMAIERVDFPS